MKFPYERDLAALTQIFQTAESQLALKIERDLRSGRLGTATYRARQLAEIKAFLVNLDSAVTPQAVSILKAAYEQGVAVAEIAGIDGAQFAGIHADAVEVLADSMTNRLRDALTTVGRQVEDVFRKEGLRSSALQLAEGSTRAEASTSLVDTLTRQGVSGFEDRAGREWGLRTYSDMVMRTTTREAVSQGTRNRLIEGGIDLVEWSGNGENCDQCQALDGNVYSLTGATDGYDVLEDLPPIHPNCTCVLTPASVTFEQLEKSLA
ncbi:MAG: hypothetical protein J0H98_08150 [Solirubrobacterales bacterium]|nr:hypothetical protein [Solirubrobacterales bacterium]